MAILIALTGQLLSTANLSAPSTEIPSHTGEYYIALIELNKELKDKETAEQQDALSAMLGFTLTSEQLGRNGIGFTHIHHIGINVADYTRAKHIWEEVLGLAAEDTDVDLPFLANIADAFFIGGTKAGALIGEALVYPGGDAPQDLFTQIKRHGALLSKGRLTGLSFDTLFTDELYFKIGRHADRLAGYIKTALLTKGYSLFIDTPSNQLFFVVENDKIDYLRNHVIFNVREALDEKRSVIRLVTSWGTTEELADKLINLF